MYYKFEENTNLRRQNYRSDFSLNLLTGKFIHLLWTSTIVSRYLEASWKKTSTVPRLFTQKKLE